MANSRTIDRNPERPLGSPRQRKGDNIKEDFRQMEGEGVD
jgi:hypothetical protein